MDGADQPAIPQFVVPLATHTDRAHGPIIAGVHLAGQVPTAIKQSANLAASTVLAPISLMRAFVQRGGLAHSAMHKGYQWRRVSTPISLAFRPTLMQLSPSICFQ